MFVCCNRAYGHNELPREFGFYVFMCMSHIEGVPILMLVNCVIVFCDFWLMLSVVRPGNVGIV